MSQYQNFDIHSIRFNKNQHNGKVFAVIGENNEDRYKFIRHLLSNHTEIYHQTVVVSGLTEGYEFFQSIVPETNLHREFNMSIIENCLERQKNVLEQMKVENDETTINPSMVIVLDDCLDEQVFNERIIRILMMNGRLFKMSVILSMKRVLSLSPMMRGQIDYSVLFKIDDDEYNNIWYNYAQEFDTLELLQGALMVSTINGQALVVHKTSKSNQLTDFVSVYRPNISI